MPKAILEFNLPEDDEDFKITLKAGTYHCVLWEVSNYIRSLDKYDEREQIPKDEIVEKIRELLSGAEL